MDVRHALMNAQKRLVQPAARFEDLNNTHGSSPAMKVGINGLFWKNAEGEPESPIGPLVAYAAGMGYREPQGDEPSPFHGYYYRILTGQGQTAQGGAKSYIANGEMTGGFAILAYPADYRSSGVMTFMVNQTGVIYQKDLGAKPQK